MKKLCLLTVTLVICSCICVFSFSCKSSPLDVTYEKEDADKPTEIITPLNVTLPKEGEEGYAEKMKEVAYSIYLTANSNYKAMDKCAIWVTMNTTMDMMAINGEVPGYRYYIKNGDKFYFAEYSDGSDSGILKLASKKDVYFASISYTDAQLKQLYMKKIVAPNFYAENNMVMVKESFDNVEFTAKDKPIYYSAQDKPYEQTEQKISKETMLSAEVEYDAENGYYVIEMELDVKNPITTAITVQNIANSGVDEPSYTSIKEYIEVWDNGYYKYFRSVDGWKGKRGIKIASTIDYVSYFHYTEEYCNLSNYQFYDSLSKACAEYEKD